MSEDNRTRKLMQALRRLEKEYEVPPPPTGYSPLETLVAAILMESVSRDRAYEAVDQMRKHFVDWNEVRVSMGKEIAEHCRPVHVTESTGRAIQQALEKVRSDCNSMSLDALKDKNAKEVREYLTTFNGLSPATVAYTMLYGLNKSAIPVTPPIQRVAERLGIADEGCPADRLERFLERIIPSGQMATFFECFNQHGETVCFKKEPKCGICTLDDLCLFRKESKARRKPKTRAVKRAESRSGPTQKRTRPRKN